MTLAVHALTQRIDRATILEDISIEVRAGEMLGLLGPNGAGKSTLLGALAGDFKSTVGHASLDGQDLACFDALARARRRAVMRQHGAPAFDFTVREIVELGRSPWIGRSTAAEDRRAVSRALALADVERFADRAMGTLSGGERQRAQFARALAQLDAPPSEATAQRYLLLDEPTSSLDLSHQQALLAAVRRLAAEGLGICVVLHDLNLAARYCDRMLVLRQGRAHAMGAPSDIMSPAVLEPVYDVRFEMLRTGSSIVLAVL
jgi:iron complex transport system ATP-binding protein